MTWFYKQHLGSLSIFNIRNVLLWIYAMMLVICKVKLWKRLSFLFPTYPSILWKMSFHYSTWLDTANFLAGTLGCCKHCGAISFLSKLQIWGHRFISVSLISSHINFIVSTHVISYDSYLINDASHKGIKELILPINICYLANGLELATYS